MIPLWKQRYYATGINAAQIASAAPERGLVICTRSGASQLYAWHVSTGELRRLTDRPIGIRDGMTSPNGQHVIYFRDEGGSETGHYVRIPWEGGGIEGGGTDDAGMDGAGIVGTGTEGNGIEGTSTECSGIEDLTPDLPNYAVTYRMAISSDGSTFAFAPTGSDRASFYILRFGEDGTIGEPRCLYTSRKPLDDATLCDDGSIAVVATCENSAARQYELLAFDCASGNRIARLSDLTAGSVRATGFGHGKQLLATSDRTGFVRPIIWDILSGQRIDLPLGDLEGDIQPLDWSRDGERILLCCTWRATSQLLLYHCSSEKITKLDHPMGSGYTSARFMPGGDTIIAPLSDCTHPTRIVALDGFSGQIISTILGEANELPSRSLRSVSFSSSDGQLIQGWLGEPDGTRPFPTVLEMHGGPFIASTDTYDPNGQAWLDHGFAFLSLNYRGSATFGRDFKEKIWGDLGHWEIEDMVAAYQWLVDARIAQPDAVVLTGASYGGYLTLMGLGKRPDLWACGIAQVAPADLVSNYEDGNAWTRAYFTAAMGGPLEERRDAYVRSSPITYAEKISAPLLVIQAKSDLRCPPQQMIKYAEKMRSLGKHFEIDWFEGGHRSMPPESLIRFQERSIAFAQTALRYTSTNICR